VKGKTPSSQAAHPASGERQPSRLREKVRASSSEISMLPAVKKLSLTLNRGRRGKLSPHGCHPIGGCPTARREGR